MDPHPGINSEVDTKDAAAGSVGEVCSTCWVSFLAGQVFEQNRAGSLAGRNTAQSQEGACWGLLNVRVGSCLYVDRGLHDFHLLRAGREPNH